jgi:hypothetical protein
MKNSIPVDINSSKPFTYEEALCIQIEGALEVMNQANQELSTVVQRVHDYLKDQAEKKGKGRASEEDGPPPNYQLEEERT